MLHDCPHEPVHTLLLLQNSSQLIEPPQLSWEKSHVFSLMQIQLAPTQLSGLLVQPARSISGRRRRRRISPRMMTAQPRQTLCRYYNTVRGFGS